MGVIFSSLLHCWLKHSHTKFILGLTAQERPSCLITLIIMLSFIIFFCCSPLPTAECKHPNPSTHKSRQLLHCWTVSKKHIFKDSISVPLSPFSELDLFSSQIRPKFFTENTEVVLSGLRAKLNIWSKGSVSEICHDVISQKKKCFPEKF